jgi:hypothetical protein
MNKQQRRNRKTAVTPAQDSASTSRDTIRAKLDDIAAAVHLALLDANLAQPVFLSIPSGGTAILTFATPLDPCDADWDRIGAIVRATVGEKTGVEGLIGRELACAVAAGSMAMADLHAG